MNPAHAIPKKNSARSREGQFSLTALLEFVTWCAILSSLSGVLGIAASVCLMLMTVAISARWGPVAFALFVAACVTAFSADNETQSIGRQFAAAFVTVAITAWFYFKRWDRSNT